MPILKQTYDLNYDEYIPKQINIESIAVLKTLTKNEVTYTDNTDVTPIINGISLSLYIAYAIPAAMKAMITCAIDKTQNVICKN